MLKILYFHDSIDSSIITAGNKTNKTEFDLPWYIMFYLAPLQYCIWIALEAVLSCLCDKSEKHLFTLSRRSQLVRMELAKIISTCSCAAMTSLLLSLPLLFTTAVSVVSMRLIWLDEYSTICWQQHHSVMAASTRPFPCSPPLLGFHHTAAATSNTPFRLKLFGRLNLCSEGWSNGLYRLDVCCDGLQQLK